MNKLFTKIAALALGATMAVGVGVAVASNGKEATPVHASDSITNTITFGSGSKVSSYTSSFDENDSASVGWTISKFNNNNWGWSSSVSGANKSIKVGNKTSASVGTIQNKSELSNTTFTKVDLYISARTNNYINSITVYGGSSSSSVTTQLATVSNATPSTSTPTSLTLSNQSSYKFYKIAFDMKKHSSSNGLLTLDKVCWYQNSSTPITAINLSGTGVSGSNPNYTYNIASSSDTNQKTVTVGLNPTTATDQVVKVEHYSGTSGLLTFDSTVTCTSGSGSFHFTGKGNAGTEKFKLYGKTETSVISYLEVSVGTYYTVTFNSNGGSSSPAAQQVEEDDTFEFPSPGTKTHYSFDGWSSDGGTTKYATGATSPAVVDDITYTAYWTEDAKYTVTYSAGTHGTGSYAHTNQYGGTYTLLAFANVSGVSADSGYRFKNYTVGGVNKDPGDTFTLSAATTVTVNFEEQPPEDVLTSSVIPAAAVGSSTSSWGTASTFSDSTGAVYTGRFMGVSSSSFIGRLNDSANGYIYTSTVPSNMKLKAVSISSMTASKTVGVYAQSGAYTACVTDKSTALGTITPDSLTYTFDSNTSYNAICLRGHTSATEIGTVTITYEALAVLNSVTTSGQTTSFTAGNKFSYGGTLTAHYTAGKADATVSPAYFKYGASGINPTTAGTAITTAVTMEVGEHSGKYIYVVYTEDNITKWASYQITVNYAPVTSVVIDTHAAEIGLNETYDYNLVGVTVNTEYAQQGYEWIVSGNTVNNDYAFNASGLLSGDTEGTITLRCRSTADNSKYDELVVTVTGDPTASFTPASVSGYAGKSVDVEFTYGNIDNENLISIISSNTSAVTVGTIIAENDEGLVTINLIASGNSTLSISYNGGETLDSVVVTVSNDSVVALNWTASNIKCYSGVVLPVSIEDTWMVNYEMASGDADYITYSDGDYTVKLGGSTITLPHTWSAEDNGKTLCVEYMGFQSSTVTVDVTQTLQAVMASETSSWDYTFTAKAWSAKGDWTLDDKLWNMSGTDDGSPYFGYDATKGQQFGSGSHPFSDVSLQSSAFSGTIDSVTVYTSGANSINATVQVSVGGTAYGDAQTITATNTPYTFDLGGKSGTISIDYVNSSSKAIYIKEIVVNTVSGSHNIANASGHEAAQKAVVKFAKAFNAAMDTTENCTTNMSSAWSTATTAWNTFTSEAAALGSTEEAYAKNLIKYATAQWTKNTDSDYSYCLERAMATYETCVQKHGQDAFLSTVRPVGRSVNINPISIIGSKSDFNVISIVVITSVISLTVIGGYFFLRKRKENI